MAIVRKSIVGTSIMALVLSLSTASVITLSATPAFAERGGNGNGGANRNSRSNRDKGRSENARSRNGNSNNGRGAVASELRGLNAAHANQTALENASPNSMPGKLYVYQQAQQEYAELAVLVDAANERYAALLALTTDEQRAELFPAPTTEEPVVVDGEEEPAPETVIYDEEAYKAAVDAAQADVRDAEADAQEAETTVQTSLDVLTNGGDLSDAALAELNRLLGL